MTMSAAQRKVLLKLIGDAYPVEGSFSGVLLNATGLSLDDLAGAGPRMTRYRAAVVGLEARNLIFPLFEEIFDDQPDNTQLKEALADLLIAIWPEGLPNDPHLHLLADDVAFVDRDELRGLLARIVNDGRPRAILMRGRSLAGVSHCFHLIRHVAKQKGGIEVLRLDFDRVFDRTPLEVVRTLALQANLGPPPERNDLLDAEGRPDTGSPQLRSHLCNWFIGAVRDRRNRTGKALWVLIDNAHREILPGPAREMVAEMAVLVNDGLVEGLHLFVLGAEQAMPVLLPFTVKQIEIRPLGRPDVVAYLAAVRERLGSLDVFATDDLAADEVLAGCDLANPEAAFMQAMTNSLTELVLRVR